jgi:hypothetical protein
LVAPLVSRAHHAPSARACVVVRDTAAKPAATRMIVRTGTSLGMDIHLFRLVVPHLSRFEQICVISTGRQERAAPAHLHPPEKN